MAYLLMHIVYTLLYAAALIVLMPLEYFRRPRKVRRRWLRERFGRYELPGARRSPGGRALWVHAVSVGETIAAAPLLKGLASRDRSLSLFVSTVTDTGQQVAGERVGAEARVIYVPFDLPWSVNRALDLIQPSLLVIMETELWPNLIRTASARRIPVLLVNGRISERSYRGYRRIRFFVSDLLRSVSMCCMQNEIYAQRIRDLGAPQERVRVVGSLKFDTQPLKSVPEWTGILSGPVIVAGSTHRTEEDLILDAFVALRRDFPDLNVILAPRHPERFREVEELTRKRGLAYLKRSELDRTAVAGKERKSGIVVILDAMGELSAVYGSCDVAVMGGSFISHGGQNPLEPAYWAKPIVCGPHMENFPFIAEFYRRGGAAEVDAHELTAHLHALLSSPEKRAAMGNNARALCEENAGASGRTLDVIEEFLRRGNG